MIGEALAAAAVTTDVLGAALARIGGPIGDAARRAHAELTGLPAEARRTLRLRWAAAARAPVPSGVRGADPSWIEAGLRGLPPLARTAIATGAIDDRGVWLARWACAALPSLPAIDPRITTPVSIDEAVRMAAPALRAWLEAIGIDQLAFALGPHAAQAEAVLGARLAAAAIRIGQAPRAGQLGTRRGAIARARGELDELALLRIGARSIAPHAAGLAGRQLAVRLQRALGLVVQSEIAAHAGAPHAIVPTWLALGAG